MNMMNLNTDGILRISLMGGQARAFLVDSTQMVEKARKTHNLSRTATAALGRTLTAACVLGNMLKGDDESVTCRIDGNGPMGLVMAVAKNDGCVKGFVAHPEVDPPRRGEKLDVGGAVGHGSMYIIKDLGMNEPYVGVAPIVSGEIAEDLTEYFATSEQTPTVCALGVRVDHDNMCFAAGGYLVQLMPGYYEEDIPTLENNIGKMESVSKLIADGKTGEEIIAMILDGIGYEMFDEFDIDYTCPCNRDKYLRALIGLNEDDMNELRAAGEPIETNCRFCGKKFVFELDELDELLLPSVQPEAATVWASPDS